MLDSGARPDGPDSGADAPQHPGGSDGGKEEDRNHQDQQSQGGQESRKEGRKEGKQKAIDSRSVSDRNEPRSDQPLETGDATGSPSSGQGTVPQVSARLTRKLSESAGASYGALIEAQLAEERLTKTSLEQRGITVITTAGTIVGLLFGLVAVITKATEFALPAGARPWLTWSLISFTASTLGGLLVNFPFTYEEADPASLREFILTDQDTWAPDWEDSDFEGSRQVAELNVRLLEVARAANSFKAKFLFGTQLLEIIGIGLLAIAILFVTQFSGS